MTCPSGVVVAGGWDGESSPPVDGTVAYNKPLGANAWEVIMVNDDAYVSASFHAVATCAASGATAASVHGLSRSERAQVARDVARVRARRSLGPSRSTTERQS